MGRTAHVLSLATVLGSLACAAPALPIEGGTTTGSDGGATTTAIAESTSTHDADGSSGTSATSTGTGGTTDDSGQADGPKFDMPTIDAPNQVATCAGSDAAVDLDMVTPSGPFAPTHAWWAWEFCCIADPWLVLSEAAELEVRDGVVTTPHVVVYVPGTWERTEPYVGPRDVVLQDVGASNFGEPIAGFELIEPLDPDVPPDAATPDLVGTFAIDGKGWAITGSVTAPYCPAIEGPACPCE